ncbi:hypothetical protein [Nannocystis pusilla]|uniref:hypothetical protein n=1 Tax=Nannocystis pusilla TaxID=889268 RepID=UPI003B814499
MSARSLRRRRQRRQPGRRRERHGHRRRGDTQPTTGAPEPPPDLVPVYDCEPSGTPACPEGQKCTAVSEGGLQNHFKCVPDDSAILPFEPCVPAPESGQDGCGAGTVCLSPTQDDPTSGLCFPICRNDVDCDPGLCVTSPFSGTTYCADTCDPLVAICPPNLGCRQGTDRFVCEMLLDIDMGTEGTNCSEFNGRGCAPRTCACQGRWCRIAALPAAAPRPAPRTRATRSARRPPL